MAITPDGNREILFAVSRARNSFDFRPVSTKRRSIPPTVYKGVRDTFLLERARDTLVGIHRERISDVTSGKSVFPLVEKLRIIEFFKEIVSRLTN